MMAVTYDNVCVCGNKGYSYDAYINLIHEVPTIRLPPSGKNQDSTSGHNTGHGWDGGKSWSTRRSTDEGNWVV